MNMSSIDSSSSDISPDEWERIARYVTGEAGSVEAETTERWIEADPHRGGVVRLLESVLTNVSRDQSSDLDVERALIAVKSRFEDPKVIPLAPLIGGKEQNRSLGPFLRVAAAAVIIVGVTLLWQNYRNSQGALGTQTFATSAGERREVALKDGSKVLLGPTSRLVVAAVNDGDRVVTLDGIAYFSVVHDPAHPFSVKAGATRIEDVGTAFSVEHDDSAGTRVAVDSGAVAIGPADRDLGDAPVLNARDRAIINTKGVLIVERAAVSDDDLAWIGGRLVFRDAPLVLVGAELYRWYGVRLRVTDSSLANLHLTASFSGEPVDRVLNVIALSLGARIERKGNVAILSRATASGARP